MTSSNIVKILGETNINCVNVVVVGNMVSIQFSSFNRSDAERTLTTFRLKYPKEKWILEQMTWQEEKPWQVRNQ